MKIPLFPLNLVLLPNEELSLHIFESRYKKMVRNVLDNEKLVGVITQTDLASYLRDQILVDGTIKSISQD